MMASSPRPGSQSAYTTRPADTALTGAPRSVATTRPSHFTPLARVSPKAAVMCPATGQGSCPRSRPNAAAVAGGGTDLGERLSLESVGDGLQRLRHRLPGANDASHQLESVRQLFQVKLLP